MNNEKKTVVFHDKMNLAKDKNVDVLIYGFGLRALAGPVGFSVLVIDRDYFKKNPNDFESSALLIKNVFLEMNSEHQVEDIEMSVCKMLNNELKRIKTKTINRKTNFYSFGNINTNFDRFKTYGIKQINPSKQKYARPFTAYVKQWLKEQMEVLQKEYPNYSFSRHLGLAKKKHKEEITEFGYSPIHFRKLTPIEELGMSKCFNNVNELFFKKEIDDFSEYQNCSIGIDEVGVGSLFGSLVCGFVLLPKNHTIKELPIDSKKLSDTNIQKISKSVIEQSPFVGVFALDNDFVDQFGANVSNEILWHYCHKRIREHFPNNRIVIDGGKTIQDVENTSFIPRADAKMDFVSAASIVSKFFCDEEIRELSKIDPRFELSKNKGYDTLVHMELIEKYGISPFHRPNMIKERLDKGGFEIDMLELKTNELNDVIDATLMIWDNKPSVFSDFAKDLLFGNVKKVRSNSKISPKVMFYLHKNCLELIEKTKKEIPSLSSYDIKPKEKMKRSFDYTSFPTYNGSLMKRKSSIEENTVIEEEQNNTLRLLSEIKQLIRSGGCVLNEEEKKFLNNIYINKISRNISLSSLEELQLNIILYLLQEQKNVFDYKNEHAPYILFRNNRNLSYISQKTNMNKELITQSIFKSCSLGLFHPFKPSNQKESIIVEVNLLFDLGKSFEDIQKIIKVDINLSDIFSIILNRKSLVN